MKQQPVVVERLSQLGRRQQVAVSCGNPRCRRYASVVWLDIEATIAAHGDLPLVGLGGRFRCGLCGHRPADTRLVWDLPRSRAVGWVSRGSE